VLGARASRRPQWRPCREIVQTLHAAGN